MGWVIFIFDVWDANWVELLKRDQNSWKMNKVTG